MSLTRRRALASILAVAGTGALFLGSAAAWQDRHWLGLNGADWSAMDGREQAAWMRGYLTGRAAGQLPDSVLRDTLAAPRALEQLRQAGELTYGFAVPLYTNRLNDFYHWDNHRPLPLWRAMEDVNAELQRGRDR